MTAVANPPSFQQLNRSGWNFNGTQDSASSMNNDDLRGMFVPRKPMQRSNSSSSISSASSASSNTTVATNNSQSNGTSASANSDMSTWSAGAARKRPQPKIPWAAGKPDNSVDLGRMPAGRPAANGINGGGALQQAPGQPQMQLMSQQSNAAARPMGDAMPSGQPALQLLSLNGTFERKNISVPFYPDSLRIGRQTNQKSLPTPSNGFFDSKVLSRQHAEIWADRMGKIFIRDVKSSNGTFVNGTRLSQENRESEPHELQTADHLELGIDIVSEDQKTVVHHKVAAKVEHAGFVAPSNNVLDMNFGDLDPANGGSMLGPSQNGLPARGRQGSNASVASNGRMMPAASIANSQMTGPAGRGPLVLHAVTSEHIIKRLHNEMRSARLQSQDLGRTGQFINTLLSKDDVKDIEKPEAQDPLKQLPNGNPPPSQALPFRPDSKPRFSDPPAPPPQQPLPEKPDVPSLKRATTERPKSHPSNSNTTSPVRQDNVSQIIQLTEALNDAKKEIDTQSQKMKELEEKLQVEKEARELAEDLARRLEDTATSEKMNGAAKIGTDAEPSVLEETFEPPKDTPESKDVEMTDVDAQTEATPATAQVDNTEAITQHFQSQIDTMLSEMKSLKQQMDAWKDRCEKAEAERDADRQSLADMVLKIRQDEEARAEAAAKERGRSSTSRRRSPSKGKLADGTNPTVAKPDGAAPAAAQAEAAPITVDDASDKPTLSRANTITPMTAGAGTLSVQEKAIAAGVPYASMLGVVLLGMGLMAYLNGFNPPPPRTSQ